MQIISLSLFIHLFIYLSIYLHWLILSTLWATTADDKYLLFILFFARK